MDTQTLALALILELASVTCIGALVALQRRDAAVTSWVLGFLGTTLGFFLLLVNGRVPWVCFQVAGNVLIASVQFLLLIGFAYFTERPRPWRRVVTLLVLLIGTQIVFSTIWPFYPLRASLASLFFLGLTLDFLVQLSRNGKSVSPRLKRLLWGVGVAFVLFHGFRIWVSLTSSAQTLMSDPFTPTTLLATMIFAVFWGGALFVLDSSRLQKEARDHAQDLQRLNTLKDRVLAMTSHDLRGPLGNLRMLWGELSDRVHTDACVEIDAELFRVVDRSLAGTLSLLENLFAFAEHQGHRIDPDARADLVLVAHDVLEQWGPSAATKQVELVSEAARPVQVQAPFAAAVVVLRNVVGNAVKFTPSGGRVTVRVSQAEGRAALEVIDTGIGMSPELVGELLRWEQRRSRPGTAGERGSGFGLVLVRELVESWGGSVEIESQPSRGTTVRITFVPVS